MATAAPQIEVPQREVSLERIFGRAFGTIRENPVATIGIAFLLGALPSTVLTYFAQGNQLELAQRVGYPGVIAGALAVVAAGIVFAAVTHGALVQATVAHSRGRESSLGDSLTAGLAVIVPLVVASILSALGILFAMILLIVPGIMLYCVWVVATPSIVAERLGPIEGLGRSRYLTSGARWKIFGLLVILVVGSWVVSAVVAALALQFVGGARGVFGGNPALLRMPVGYYAVVGLGQTVTTCVWGVVVASLYVELRDWKDGPQTEALAEVFR
jgi:hypothetical protein